MKRTYDYVCEDCGKHQALELTIAEYRKTSNPACECGGQTNRQWLVNVPRSTQHKGFYNGSYESQKESINLLKNGGEKVNT